MAISLQQWLKKSVIHVKFNLVYGLGYPPFPATCHHPDFLATFGKAM